MILWRRIRAVITLLCILTIVVGVGVVNDDVYSVIFTLSCIGAIGIVGLISATLTAAAVGEHLWRRALVDGLWTLTISIAFFNPYQSLASMKILSAYGTLVAHYGKIERKINAQLGSNNQKLVVHKTNELFSGSLGLAYDGSDEIALEPGTQSKEWKRRAAGTYLSDKCWVANRLVGHYFVWSMEYACT